MKELVPKYLKDSKAYYVVLTDLKSKFLFFNALYFDAFKELGAQLGSSFKCSIEKEDYIKYHETILKCLDNNKAFNVKLRNKFNEGIKWTDWEFSIYKENDEPKGIIAIGHDVTYLQLQERVVKEQQNVLNKIAWNQNHVLRKPVANILGLCDLMSEMDLSVHNYDYLLLMKEQVLSIDQIIHENVALTAMSSLNASNNKV